MKSHWQFRVVLRKSTFIAKHNSAPRDMEGSDIEALEFAAKIHEHFARKNEQVERVEARSIGFVDLSPENASVDDKRIVHKLHRHGDVWQFEPHRNVASAKDSNLDWLINLAAIRSRGSEVEIRIYDKAGNLGEVVLINAEGDSD